MTEQRVEHTRPARDEILNQDGKVYVGTPNPNKESAVSMIYTNEQGKQVCSAYRSNAAKICVSPFLNENGRCKKHGGKSLTGTAHPNFKNGRRSRNLPTRLLERYEEALNDPKLADFTEDLALIEARLDALFQQIDEGGGAEIMLEIKDSYKSFTYASKDGDKQAMRESLRRLGDAINRGSREEGIWDEIRALQEQRRKIILAQAKHLQLTNQTITVQKANIIVAALLDSVRRYVTDRKTLTDITNDFLRITRGGQKQLAAKN
jgi:hypothetical protein